MICPVGMKTICIIKFVVLNTLTNHCIAISEHSDVLHILHHLSPLDINTMVANDRAAIYVLYGVTPVFKALTPTNIK